MPFDPNSAKKLGAAKPSKGFNPSTARKVQAQEPSDPSGVSLGERFSLGFSESPEQAQRYLEGIYGKNNVYFQPSSGRMFFRRTSSEKFQPVEGQGLNLKDVASVASGVLPTVLSAAGSALGAPTVAGAVAGSGLGMAAGEAANKTIGRALMGPVPDRTVGEDVKDVAYAGVMGALGEGVGRGLQRDTGKILSPFAKYADPDIMAISKRYGFPVTSGEASQSSVVDRINRFLETSIGGGGQFEKFKQTRHQQTQKLIEDVVNEVGTPTDNFTSVGERINAAVKTLKARRMGQVVDGRKIPGVTDLLYEKAKQEIGKEQIPFDTVRSRAQDLLQEVTRETIYAPSLKRFQEESKLISLLQDMAAMPKGKAIPYDIMENYRSTIIDLAKTDNLVGNQKNRIAGILGDAIDSAIETQLKQSSPQGFKALAKARSFYAKNIQMFNESVLSKMAKDNPTDVALTLFKPKSAEDAKIIAYALKRTNPQLLQQVKAVGLDELLSNTERIASTGVPRYSNPTIFTQWKKLGEETKRAIFTPEELSHLNKVVKFLTTVQTGQSASQYAGRNMFLGRIALTAQVAASGGASYAAGTGMIGVPETAAFMGVIWGAPTVLAKMALSQTGRRLLTEGFAERPMGMTAKQIADYMARFSAYLAKPDGDSQQTQPVQQTTPTVSGTTQGPQ